ncbi:MAG: DNA polymerase III subunit alpha [Armatimonadetes bacterium]|nr:DNA polymerase III subunit alpha [Armatimonadota bacterium]
MRRDGVELIARWREAGEWWAGEQPREIAQWRDKRGVRREKHRAMPSLLERETPIEWQEDLTSEICLRPRKTRDEKVALANGGYSSDKAKPVRSSTSRETYCPLHLVSGYSYGRSVLLAKELARTVASYGLPAAALVDRFSLTGAIEFAKECQECGVKPLVGSTFEMAEGGDLILIAKDKSGYVSLSQLITECHLDEERLFPICTRQRLEKYSRGLLCLTGGDSGRLDGLILKGRHELALEWLDFLRGLYGHDSVFVQVERSWLPWGIVNEERLREIADKCGLRCVAATPVFHARPGDFPAQDVALCAESLCMVDEVIGRKQARTDRWPIDNQRPLRSLNAERYLRTSPEMYELFRDMPSLVKESLRVAEKCDDDVLPSRTRLPQLFGDPKTALYEATYSGAASRHRTLTKQLNSRLELELERIVRLNFADHFLVMWDVCRWAEGEHIHLSGRGSVVDSAVAYCLGISRIDGFRHDLHFDRFLPEDGSKRPDIDIDFEARRRDDVRNYMVSKYGQDRVATVAAVGAYNTRGIVREVGKALGLSQDVTGFLAKHLHGGVVPDQLENAMDKRPELRDSGIDRERVKWLFRLAKKLADVPRNVRAHSSGVVVSDRPLSETVPVMWGGTEGNEHDPFLRIIQWDKRSAKHYFDKFDILCLRGQDVLSGTERRVRLVESTFNAVDVPVEDPENFRAMRAGELIGVPQSASPAMRQAHMRLRTKDLHDASLVQAGIRPGVGGAVKLNELIARRRGLKPFSFDHPDFEPILGHTYGIVVFQEQIDQLLQVFAGYASGEAEDIRDEIHKRRREDYGQVIKETVIERVVEKGYSQSVAEQVFEYVAGFKGYGFAQGHALAFAEISLRSIYCQQNYPAEYFASLLDAQPAGYYGPCTLVNEARVRGVEVLPVDINHSVNNYKVEDVRSPMEPHIVLPNGGVRIALTQVAGLSKQSRERTVAEAPFSSFHDFVRRVRPASDELESLVLCGAFDTLSPNRRALLWAVPQALVWAKETDEGLWAGVATDSALEPGIDGTIADFTLAEKAVRERTVLGLDVKRHLMEFERERVQTRGGVTCREARDLSSGRKAIVVGNPIRLRFPPTPSGKRVVFFDLEDESGLLNVTCFDRVYQRDGHAIVTCPYVTLIGVSQWRDGHSAFIVQRAFPYDPEIARMVDFTEPLPVTIADFLVG